MLRELTEVDTIAVIRNAPSSTRMVLHCFTGSMRLLEAGLVVYLASDFHGHSTLKIYKAEAWTELQERGSTELLEVLCRTNPSRLLTDEEPVPVGGVTRDTRLLSKLRGMIKREPA